MISRAEIADRLWSADVFVDVETGVNTAVRKVRLALGDSAEAPAFVETVPGKGYRFIATVDAESLPEASPPVPEPPPVTPAFEPGGEVPGSRARSTPPWSLGLGLLLVVGLALGAAAWWWRPGATPVAVLTLAVLPFDNLGGDPDRDYLADGLTKETIHSLAQIDPARVRVIGRTSTRSYRGSSKTLAEIGQELGADYFVEGSVRAEVDLPARRSQVGPVPPGSQVHRAGGEMRLLSGPSSRPATRAAS